MFGASRRERRTKKGQVALAHFNDWVGARVANREAEELEFRNAIERGIIEPPPEVRETQTDSGPTESTSAALSVALREIARASIHSQEVAQSRMKSELGGQLSTLRSISFEADNLAADIHHSLDSQIASTRSGGRPRPGLLRWLRNPVGSGGVVGATAAEDLGPIYAGTAVLRVAGAIACLALMLSGNLGPAAGALLFSVVTSGILRYATNAESAVSFRARYLSCVAGHAGDVTVLLGLAWYADSEGLRGTAAIGVLTVVGMLFGSLMRTGALSAGVHVPRIRMERVARVGGMAICLVLYGAGVPWGLLPGFATVAVWTAIEILRVMREVTQSNTALFTWVAIDRDETVTGEIESTPYEDDRPLSVMG